MRITTCYNVTNNIKTGTGKFEGEVEMRDQQASCAPTSWSLIANLTPKPQNTVVNIIKICRF